MKWMKQNKLDEMQEMKLSMIEKRGCWFAFWALLAVMAVQLTIFKATPAEMAGEWIVFMCLAMYLAVACIRAGIWDRHIPATPLANFIASLIAGIVVWILNIIVMVNQGFQENVRAALFPASFIGILTFILCMILMTIATTCYKKRVKKLESEPEEEM